MTLLQMSYILEIDRCGSMNKAAQALFVSQSALSSAISEVEKELGIRIFLRSNRGIKLTEDGRELLGRIAPIVEGSRRLSQHYEHRRAPDWVQLSIAAQRFPFCAKAFVELLRSLRQRPMQVSLKEMDMAAVIRELASGASELGIIFVSDRTDHAIRRSLEEHQLRFEPLLSLRPQVFMRRDHPLAQERSLTVDQLRPYPNVVFTQTDYDPNYAEEAVAGSGAGFEQLVYVSDRATIYNIMAHTDCVSTGSGVLPVGYTDERLIAVPLEDYFEMRLGYVCRSGQALSELALRFIGMLTRVLEETR
ncbi:MAG: LysR family transcriptional regulator [Oscillospiraceae bacterium]|nr:LysR family transcriptional regulator [Oscillospiraceae bacterium]